MVLDHMKIQPYHSSKAQEIADLFSLAVHAISPEIYTLEEKQAWARVPPDYAVWQARLAEKQPLLAMLNDKVIGFIELDPDGHIDCMYTHPEHQRQGVGAALYAQTLVEAKKLQLQRLYVEASYLAKPFCEQRGFKVLNKNKFKRGEVTLINFTMEKHLV